MRYLLAMLVICAVGAPDARSESGTGPLNCQRVIGQNWQCADPAPGNSNYWDWSVSPSSAGTITGPPLPPRESAHFHCAYVAPGYDSQDEVNEQRAVTATVTLAHYFPDITFPASGIHDHEIVCNSVSPVMYAGIEIAGKNGGYYTFDFSYFGGDSNFWHRLREKVIGGSYGTLVDFGYVGGGTVYPLNTPRWYRGETCFTPGSNCDPFFTAFVPVTKCNAGGGL